MKTPITLFCNTIRLSNFLYNLLVIVTLPLTNYAIKILWLNFESNY